MRNDQNASDQSLLGAARGSLAIEPITVRISMAVQLTGLSRSRIYELIEAGDLETVKVGRSTFIPFKSLKGLFER